MITTRFYLDTRATDGEAPLKLAIHKRHAGAFLGTGVRLLPSQWDARAQRVINHPQKGALNSFLGGFKFKVDTFIRDAVLDGSAADMTARDIKDWLDALLHGQQSPSVTLSDLWNARQHKAGTQRLINSAYRSILRYDPTAGSRDLSSLSERWVRGYVDYLQGEALGGNTRHAYLSRLKAVLNEAVRAGYIKSSPAAGVQSRIVQTKRRNLSAEQMRLMITAPVTGYDEQVAVDFFSLSFYLRAANPADLVALTPGNIFNGRIDYIRQKTGKSYSVRLEAEARAVIDRYATTSRLFPMPPRYRSYQSFLTAMDAALRSRAVRLGLPNVSCYWARHTFASLAFELGYGMDLVSAALGHSLGGARVTSTYVNIVDKQVDDLARAVYDYIAPSAHSGSDRADSNSVPVGGSSK